MKTYALLFSIDVYEREELEKMSAHELYDLAFVSAGFGNEGEADVLTLDELSYKVNHDKISLEYSWLYFVTI